MKRRMSEAIKRKCVQISKNNKYEYRLKKILDSMNIKYMYQKVFFYKDSEKYRIVDFYLPKPKKIIIEIDGASHMVTASYDMWKDRCIMKRIKNIKIIRLKPSQIKKEIVFKKLEYI